MDHIATDRPDGPIAFRAVSFEIKLLIAALFWVIGYAILAVRAALADDGGPPPFSEARLVATLAGSAMLLGIMLLWERLHGTGLASRIAVLGGALVVACAAMFAVRLAVAQVYGLFGPSEFADGGRWLIAWAGYFLAAVSSYVAFAAVKAAELAATLPCAATGAATGYECADDVFALPSNQPVGRPAGQQERPSPPARQAIRQFSVSPP